MNPYQPRYEGARWAIVYGSNQAVEKFALETLYRKVQAFLPYVLGLYPAVDLTSDLQQMNLILIGTLQNNPWIKQVIEDKARLGDVQGYLAAGMASPWHPQRRMIILTGGGPNGVLYGTQDFTARILSGSIPEKPTPTRLQQAFDALGDFWIQEQPAITNRGIWTWGYVIYDYRRFLDHMARLKMNLLTIWNDCPPVNIGEVIEYAHSRGIRILLGFSWGWGMPFDISLGEERQKIKDMVLAEFKEKYARLGMDGIYFQTLTEHNNTELGGQSVARLTCEMVNQIAGSLFEMQPGLSIQFGLHATSIQDRYLDLSDLDARVTIAWEDAGVLPYAYVPMIERSPEARSNSFHLDTLAETLAYSQKLATFRPGTEFAIVPKGWSNLDWAGEFEHHGPFLLGVRDSGFIRERTRQRKPYWDKIDALWLKHYRHAVDFYRAVLSGGALKMTVTGLVEDGVFEESIPLSVALFAETLWNPSRDAGEILQLALSPYYHE
jgi:hypothetical protein